MKRIPFRYRMIRGAIGKRFVIKHYRGGRVVMTRYPDMSGIIPSEEQKMQRRLFKRATAYAKKVYAKPALREEKRRLFRKPKRLFQALIKEWFAKRRKRDFYRQRRINRWQQNYQQNKMEVGILGLINHISRQNKTTPLIEYGLLTSTRRPFRPIKT